MANANDFFDNVITDISADDSIFQDNDEELSPEEMKASAAMHIRLTINICTNPQVKAKNITELFKKFNEAYSDLFSIFHTECQCMNLEEKIDFHLYYTLNDKINVNKLYYFNRSILSLCISLSNNGSAYNLLIDIAAKKNSGYLIFKNSFTEDLKASTAYLNACLFYANDRFDDYIRRFTLKSVVDAVYNKLQSVNSHLTKYVSQYTLYTFIPLLFVSTNYYGEDTYSVLFLNSFPGITYIFKEKNHIDLIPEHLSGDSNIQLNYGFLTDNSIDDYELSLKSPALTTSEAYAVMDDIEGIDSFYCSVIWHEKPFYIKQLNDPDKTRMIPAIAVEIKKKDKK